MRNALQKSIRFKSIFKSYFHIHDFYVKDETNINHKKTRLKTTRLRQALRSFAFTRRFVNVTQRERNRKFETKIAKKLHNNHRFDCFFDQNIVQNSILLKSKMRKRRTNDQTQTTKINRNAYRESMKRLFTRFEYQEENHREKTKLKFKKTFEIFTNQSTIF
jgi:hypothetical protein